MMLLPPDSKGWHSTPNVKDHKDCIARLLIVHAINEKIEMCGGIKPGLAHTSFNRMLFCKDKITANDLSFEPKRIKARPCSRVP